MKQKASFKRELKKNHFRVAIFGSARIKKSDQPYKLVYTLSKMIAKEGMDVVTGGGPGLMEAANKGHRDGKNESKQHSHSLGLRIKLPFEQKENKHLDIEREFSRFSERLDTFMMLSNIVVVAPGGIGTILELFYTMQLSQVKHICDMPIILLGDMWVELLVWIKRYPLRRKLLNKEDLDNIFVSKNCTDALKIIKSYKAEYLKGKKDFCRNLEKYNFLNS